MTLSKAGYSVGYVFFWYGVKHRVVSIDSELKYDYFGQPHVAVLAEDGRTYHLPAN